VLRLEIQGGKELAASLGQLGDDLARTAPQQAFSLILSAAEARAPVRTGALRASGFVQGDTVGFGVRYAVPVHWGARGRPARPFLRDAIRQTEDQWLKVYEEDVQKQLDNVRGV
jgi:HK97 gp10 family phage protein